MDCGGKRKRDTAFGGDVLKVGWLGTTALVFLCKNVFPPHDEKRRRRFALPAQSIFFSFRSGYRVTT